MTHSTTAPPSSLAQTRQVDYAKADLAQRLGIQTEAIEVMEVRPVIWPDGALGCPRPGMGYIQVQQDGLLIRLRAGGRVYEYHSGGARPPFLCEQPDRRAVPSPEQP